MIEEKYGELINNLMDDKKKSRDKVKEAIRILEDYNSSSMLSRDQSRYKCIDFLKTNFDIKDGAN
tara:strand:- start:833 stop:1027 length:195 start_codon:yes stop_codon:yes gene_type:complete